MLRVIGKPSIVSKRSRRPLKCAYEFWLRRRGMRLSALGGRLFPVEAGGVEGARGAPSIAMDIDDQPGASSPLKRASSPASPPHDRPVKKQAPRTRSRRGPAGASGKQQHPQSEPAVGSPRAGATAAAAPTGQRPWGERAAPAEPAHWRLAAWGTAGCQGCARGPTRGCGQPRSQR